MLVYASDWGLASLAQSLHWALDGTFKAVPSLFDQLYAIHASIRDQVVPCVCAILPDKTGATYRSLLGVVRSAINDWHTGAAGIHGGTVITDLEKAILDT